MISFNKIVLTTDLSENANVATPYAVDLAKKYGGSIELLHICEDTVYYASAAAAEGFVVDIEEFSAKIAKDRESALRLACDSLSTKYGVTVKPVMRKGHAANEIVAYTKDAKPDVLVIATHGRTGLSHLLFGSVAERVIRLASCPVLSVRPDGAKS